MKKTLSPWVVVAALSMSGCASTPMAYYTLSAPVDQIAQASSPGRPSALLYTLAPVSIPAQVDDTPIIVRQSSDRLMVLSYDRWTAPLADQIRDALSQALTAQLGMPPVQNLEATGAPLPSTRVTVDVQRFDLVPAQYALLNAAWRIEPAKPAASMICYTSLRESAAPGVVALVAAQQANLQRLAQQLSAALSTGKPPAGSQCR